MPSLLFILIPFLFLSVNPTSSPQEESQSYIVIFLTQTEKLLNDLELYQPTINEHMRNLGKLTDLGVVQNVSGIEGGGELIFMQAYDVSNATHIIMEDPAVREELYTFEVLQFKFLKGGLCSPDIPYETQPYDLILFQFENDIASYKTNVSTNISSVHQDHLNKVKNMEEVVMMGSFLQRDGEMVLVERNTRTDEIKNDPASELGYMNIVIHTLWINKGVFCK